MQYDESHDCNDHDVSDYDSSDDGNAENLLLAFYKDVFSYF